MIWSERYRADNLEIKKKEHTKELMKQEDRSYIKNRN